MIKTIDNSLNRGNKTEIVGWGMPSNDYINTSFVKTQIGTYTYTAPANGYFTCGFVCGGGTGSVVVLYRNGNSIEKCNSVGFNASFSCDCKKGDKIKVQITTTNLVGVSWQSFYYAQGEI